MSDATAPKPFVFVLMPFAMDFDDVYRLGIKEVAAKAGAYAERVDEQHYHEDMLARIVNQISKADVIVADMTGRNPNVYYEVGYAHALNRIVVLLTRDSKDIPFDLAHRPHIVYGNVSELRDKLTPRLAWAIDESRRGRTSAIVSPVQLLAESQPTSSSTESPPTVHFRYTPGQPSPLICQLRNISGVSLREPITHVYVLLERDTPLTVADNTGVFPADPDLWEEPPLHGRFARRYRLRFETPIYLPAFALERFAVPLTVDSALPTPSPTYLTVLVEVCVAENVFQFAFRLQASPRL